jgi:hypothetical protein
MDERQFPKIPVADAKAEASKARAARAAAKKAAKEGMTRKISANDCWICQQSLPPEEYLKRLDEFGFTVHKTCLVGAALGQKAVSQRNH